MNIDNFTLSSYVKAQLNDYIDHQLHDINPYDCETIHAESFSKFIVLKLSESIHEEDRKLHQFILKNLRTPNARWLIVYIKNIAGEPSGSLVVPRKNRGFDYRANENDRMKKYFHAEWISWATSLMFGYTCIVHPSEHGGNNRFHMVSPILNTRSRGLSASTGGGEFFQHSDATVFNNLKTELEVISHLEALGTSVLMVSRVLNIEKKMLIEQILCGQYSRVDAIVLTGIVNRNTKTKITTPQMYQKHLEKNGFTKSDIQRLSVLPVAHIAGPADGDISGFVGNISPPIVIDEICNITSTFINLAPDRMIYVGEKPDEKNLFKKFCDLAKSCPSINLKIRAGDLVLFQNLPTKSQLCNVTHGRERISDKEYTISVGDMKLPRNLCRQYLIQCSFDASGGVSNGNG